MEQGILAKLIALRDDAYNSAWVLDEAVVRLGGPSRMGIKIAAASGSAAATGNAIAYADAIRERTRRLTQTSAAELVLRERGGPTTGADLMAALPSKGVTIGGENPTVNFTSSMSKSGKFESHRRDGKYYWWFKGEPLPIEWLNNEAPDLPLHERSDASGVGNQEGGEANATAT